MQFNNCTYTIQCQVPSCKPANTLNITDLDPAYQTDKSANTSSYAAQFDQHSLVCLDQPTGIFSE